MPSLDLHTYYTWTETDVGDVQKPDSNKTSKLYKNDIAIIYAIISIC